MSVSETPLQLTVPTPQAGPSADAPVVLEARGVEKVFRVPEHRIDTFKERAVHPFSRPDYRELRALDGVSFDVRRGEFFGIVGRNGSGKSTLLKILASIYRADAGTIRMAGRLAPFIELGVGFNPDLSARENVVLNAVMMGLTPREARRRLDAVFDFAELQGFTELKLKNYSSGMSVRLAFAVMIQSDADILLVDEVLAVGDASFQQKCADFFHQVRDSEKTVVLVTHDMEAVRTYCHRAMLLHDGELLHIGDPEEVGRRYLRLNFGGHDMASVNARATGTREAPSTAAPDLHARLLQASLLDVDGDTVTNVEHGEPVRFNLAIEAITDLVEPVFAFHCTNAEGVLVFSVHERLSAEDGSTARAAPGQRVRLSGVIGNPLAQGRYFLSCWVTSDRGGGDLTVQELQLLDFVVYGSRPIVGVVSVDAEVEAVLEAES